MDEKNNFVDLLIRKLVFALHFNVDESKVTTLIQFIKFGIVGLSNTIISYVIYVGALLFLQNLEIMPQFDYLFSQVVAFLLSVLWSFYWNNKFVFQGNNKCIKDIISALIKSYISYAFTGLILNSLLSLLWVEVFAIPKLIAPIINLIISVPLNFVLNKFWAFHNSK